MNASRSIGNPSTRLSGPLLWLARAVWVIVLLLGVGELAVGYPLVYAEKAQACEGSAEICSEARLIPASMARQFEAAGLSLDTYARIYVGFALINTLIWAGIGLLIFALRSDDWMAMLVSAMLILFATGYGSASIMHAYPQLAGVTNFLFNLQNFLLFLFIGLFPSGRFVPRWIRWYILAVMIFTFLPNQVLPKSLYDPLLGVYWLSFLILGPFSQIYRYFKASNPLERQQTRWVVSGFTVMAAGILLNVLFKLLMNPNSLAENYVPTWREFIFNDFYFDLVALALPFSIGISMLRYRLWDIDVIIRRTLVYGVVSAALALVFFGGVTVMQSVFQSVSGQQSAISVVISTLAIAALFNPLRRRTQDFIDRRFYRKKYNAEQALKKFSELARSETDIEQLSAEIMAVVRETMQPEKAGLWLKEVKK